MNSGLRLGHECKIKGNLCESRDFGDCERSLLALESEALAIEGFKCSQKGLLHTLNTDAELAAVIGHELGHAVARHIAEAIVRLILILTFLIFLLFSDTHFPSKICGHFMKFISRRREAEADYIGLMLMASAGYNPRVAPKLLKKKIGGEGGINSTHPSGIKRAKLLKKPKVMNKALAVYEEVKAGEGVRSFV
ncbi:mitochondrial metalloendopeptidase OMA1-like [Fagus crenata]